MGIAEGCGGHGAGIWCRWRAHLRQAGWVWTQGVGLPSSAVFRAPQLLSTGTPQPLHRPPCLRLCCLGGDSRCVSSFCGFFPSLGLCPCTDQGLGESLGALFPANQKLRVAPGSAQVPSVSPPQAGSWAVAGSPPLPPRPQWSPSFAACCLVSFVHF